MLPPHGERVVELRFGELSQGSGYLISPTHVLTARHVIAPLPARRGARCVVRALVDFGQAHLPIDSQRRPDPIAAEVAWVHDDDTLDIAVVKLDRPIALPAAELAVGRVPVHDVSHRPMTFIGFPEAAGTASKTYSGHASYAPGPKRFDLDVASALPTAWKASAGVSGALVFSGEHALGVVCTVDGRWDRKLTATPFQRLLENDSFRRWWESDGNRPLRPVDLDGGARASVEPAEPELPRLLAWCDRSDEFDALDQLLASAPGPRLLGLAGPTSHSARHVVRRLVDELRTPQDAPARKVCLLELTRKSAFASVAELDRALRANAAWLGAGTDSEVRPQLVRHVRAEMFSAVVVSVALECDELGRGAIERRIDVAAEWLCAPENNFPCHVVVVLILRFSEPDTRPLAARLKAWLRTPASDIRAAWRKCADKAGAGALRMTLRELEDYQARHVHQWIDIPLVEKSLGHARYIQIGPQIDSWFADRPTQRFHDLQRRLAAYWLTPSLKGHADDS